MSADFQEGKEEELEEDVEGLFTWGTQYRLCRLREEPRSTGGGAGSGPGQGRTRQSQ